MSGTESKVHHLPLDRSAPVFIAGHRGLAGSALQRRFEQESFERIVVASRAKLDLRDRRQVFRFLEHERPRYVLIAAARVGGVLANQRYPADLLSENLQIQVNVMDASRSIGVERLLFLGTSMVYPRDARQPHTEDQFMSGSLEPVNEGYAIAKIAGVMQVQAVRKQEGLPWISALPTNLYGPHDNFSAENSHVLPALIRRYVAAAERGDESVTNWGSGQARRDFLYSEDLADACLFLLEHYDDLSPVNIGTGRSNSIGEVADLVSRAARFMGRTEWDTTRPDGAAQKVLAVDKIASLGWYARTDLADGIRKSVRWYRDNATSIRT